MVAGIPGVQHRVEFGFRGAAPVFGQDFGLGAAFDPGDDLIRITIGQAAILPSHFRFPRQNVHRRAAMNDGGLNGGMGRVEAWIGIGAQLVPHTIQ